MANTIAQIRKDEKFEGYLLVRSAEQRTASSGKLYLDMTLGDRTGTINAKMWDGTVAPPPQGSIVQVRGTGNEMCIRDSFFTMIFYGGMIPTFLVVKTYNLVDTIWALIVPEMLSVYNMIIMRTFFRSIPEELEEAARIDGCSEMKILVKIVLPLSMPVLASIGLFYAVWHWNAFFDAVLYITDRKLWPLQTLLREILLSTSISELQQGNLLADSMPPSSAVVAASIMISTIPIVCVYPFLQKHFVKGVMIGSVKG